MHAAATAWLHGLRLLVRWSVHSNRPRHMRPTLLRPKQVGLGSYPLVIPWQYRCNIMGTVLSIFESLFRFWGIICDCYGIVLLDPRCWLLFRGVLLLLVVVIAWSVPLECPWRLVSHSFAPGVGGPF